MGTLRERITTDQHTCGGEPIIKGTRISVRDIVEYMRLYNAVDEVLQALPDLTAEDVEAALEYYRERPEEIEKFMQEHDDEDLQGIPNVYRRDKA